MSGRPGEPRRPVIRVIEGFRWTFAILGAPAVVFVIVTRIGDLLTLSTVAKTAIGIALTVLLLALFLGIWSFVVARDWIQDRCLPGFTANSANGLCSAARQVLPDLPNRKRNKIVMAAGLGVICAGLRRVSFSLGYFAGKRIKVLIDEVGREVIFDTGPIELFADRAGLLLDDFAEFRALGQPTMEFAYEFKAAPNPIDRSLLNEVEDVLRHVATELADLRAEAGERADPPAGKQLEALQAAFARLQKELAVGREKLESLRQPIDALERHCQSALLIPLLA